ncbi:MAG TPA: ribonuclease R [Saprospiraceae bacterium]|nr:ribonuclease R [Saprospiraceae bacterium]
MSKKKSKKLSEKQLLKEIKRKFLQNKEAKLSPNQIKKKLRLQNAKEDIRQAFSILEDQKIIRHQGKGKFSAFDEGEGKKQKDKTTVGYVDMTLSGSAYIVCEDIEDDVFVSAKNLGGAFHGDMVKIKYYYPRRRRRPEGKVLDVVERSSHYFVGPINEFKNYSIVFAEKKRAAIEIYVRPEDRKGAKNGDLVVVKVEKWPKKSGESPIGRVTSVLGSEESDEVRMKMILVNSGFPLEFPEAVMAEAEAIPEEIPLTEIHRRRDMREVLTFTIDPADAKDFDDAISLEHKDNGDIEIGVHIADVSHYVLPGTALDEEAYKRSTSVYLVGRVLPMLPEKLSNVLCSLRPNEDKLAYSVIFTFDKKKRLKGRWIGRTVIHSDHRFSYEQAQEMLDGKDGPVKKEINQVNAIAKDLRNHRFQTGSINFSTDEVRFELDEKGKPIAATVKEPKESNQLIEEFMLLANKSVALYIKEKKEAPQIPFIYRVHDLPDEDKLQDLATIAGELGFKIDTSSPKGVAKAFNAITEKAEKEPAYKIISHLAIRTMAKAEYSSDNIGHYGLGFSDYTHFTSPIRRYSDVIAHRILFRNAGDQIYRTNKAKLEEKCQHISRQERKATDAERESIKLKQAEYAEQFIGHTVEGVISGMIDRGIFVEVLDSKSEGLIGFDKFGERFDLGASNASAKGLQSGRRLKIGDTLKVKIIEVDLHRKQIEMELAED